MLKSDNTISKKKDHAHPITQFFSYVLNKPMWKQCAFNFSLRSPYRGICELFRGGKWWKTTYFFNKNKLTFITSKKLFYSLKGVLDSYGLLVIYYQTFLTKQLQHDWFKSKYIQCTWKFQIMYIILNLSQIFMVQKLRHNVPILHVKGMILRQGQLMLNLRDQHP